MAKVKGVKEKLHMPIYDAFFVPRPASTTSATPTFEDVMKQRDPRVIRFFVDVQNKTRLETNLQASGTLPSQNTFEAHAMRVVASCVNFKKNTATTPAPTPLNDSIFKSELIYSSVVSLLVGEKTMIEAPTYYFPSGAGVSPVAGPLPQTVANHGEPDPLATFRFAEPVVIEPQQNFRVEMLFPQDVPDDVRNALGPIRLWVVLDGYMTRDVQ